MDDTRSCTHIHTLAKRVDSWSVSRAFADSKRDEAKAVHSLGQQRQASMSHTYRERERARDIEKQRETDRQRERERGL